MQRPLFAEMYPYSETFIYRNVSLYIQRCIYGYNPSKYTNVLNTEMYPYSETFTHRDISFYMQTRIYRYNPSIFRNVLYTEMCPSIYRDLYRQRQRLLTTEMYPSVTVSTENATSLNTIFRYQYLAVQIPM